MANGAVRLPVRSAPSPGPIRIHGGEGWVEMPDRSRWRLQKRVMRVLAALADKPRQLVRIRSILLAMYGHPDNEPEWSESSMKNAICHLRRAGMPITTRYGQGYVLEADAVVVTTLDEKVPA